MTACLAIEALEQLYAGNAPARAAELPPHDLRAEEAVLSAVLWGDRTAAQLRLRPRWLWSPEHQGYWAVLLTMEEIPCERLAWGAWCYRKPWSPREDSPLPSRPGPSRLCFGAGVDLSLVARIVAAGGGSKYSRDPPLTLRRLREIMDVTGDPEAAAASIKARARERALLDRVGRIGAALRAGERPDPDLVDGAAANLRRLAMED